MPHAHDIPDDAWHRVNLALDSDPTVRRPAYREIARPSDERGQVDRPDDRAFDPARFELREVQQVIDHVEQMTSAGEELMRCL